MYAILELWDIHEHNARIINNLLMIDKKFIFKKISILWTSAAQFLNSFICILDIIFTDSVN